MSELKEAGYVWMEAAALQDMVQGSKARQACSKIREQTCSSVIADSMPCLRAFCCECA
jgi:hypothetical protein